MQAVVEINEETGTSQSSLSLDENGTATLILFNHPIKVMPQSDTIEWQPCD
jgi:hypothetical protein